MKNILEKIKLFIATAGITKIVYFFLGVFFFMTGSNILMGAAFGIFIYINYNVLYKLIAGKLKKTE